MNENHFEMVYIHHWTPFPVVAMTHTYIFRLMALGEAKVSEWANWVMADISKSFRLLSVCVLRSPAHISAKPAIRVRF